MSTGKGLTVVATVLEGGYLDNIDNVLLSQQVMPVKRLLGYVYELCVAA